MEIFTVLLLSLIAIKCEEIETNINDKSDDEESEKVIPNTDEGNENTDEMSDDLKFDFLKKRKTKFINSCKLKLCDPKLELKACNQVCSMGFTHIKIREALEEAMKRHKDNPIIASERRDRMRNNEKSKKDSLLKEVQIEEETEERVKKIPKTKSTSKPLKILNEPKPQLKGTQKGLLGSTLSI